MSGYSVEAGVGGTSVTTEKFSTLERCNKAKRAYLNMRIQASELQSGGGRRTRATIVRKAECVYLGETL